MAVMNVLEKIGRVLARRKVVLRWLFFVLAVGGLVWLLDSVGWSTIGGALAHVGLGGGAVILAFSVCENLGDAASLRAALPRKIGLFEVMTYNCAGAIANDLLPVEAGEVLKATLVSARIGAQDSIAGTVVWNYVFKFVRPAMALLAALSASIIGTQVNQAAGWTVVAASVVAFVPFAVLVLLVRRGAARLAVRLAQLVGLGRNAPEHWIAAASHLDERIRHFRKERPGDFRRVIGYQLLARTASWLMHVAVIRAIGLDLDLATCTILYAGFSMAHYLVTLMPAKLGVGEGAGYMVFSAFGLDGGTGVIVYVVLRLRTLVTSGIPGLFAVLSHRRGRLEA